VESAVERSSDGILEHNVLLAIVLSVLLRFKASGYPLVFSSLFHALYVRQLAIPSSNLSNSAKFAIVD